jgi:hypothetical protein
MLAEARALGGHRGAKIAKNNADAFEVFETEFFQKIAKYRQHFLPQGRSGVVFEGLALEGAPHFEAVDDRGKTRHVFLHAAKWTGKDLSAYLELLGIIVEEDFGGDLSSIWVMDLRGGKEIRWRSSARVRKRCQAAAKLYARLVGTVQAP